MASTSVFVYGVSPNVDLDILAQHLDALVTPSGTGSRKSSLPSPSRGNECIVSFNYDTPVELQNDTLDFHGQELHAFVLPTEIIETVRLRKEWTDNITLGVLSSTSNKPGIRVNSTNGIVELHGEMNGVIDAIRDIQHRVIDALTCAHTRTTGPRGQRQLVENDKVSYGHSETSTSNIASRVTEQQDAVPFDKVRCTGEPRNILQKSKHANVQKGTNDTNRYKVYERTAMSQPVDDTSDDKDNGSNSSASSEVQRSAVAESSQTATAVDLSSSAASSQILHADATENENVISPDGSASAHANECPSTSGCETPQRHSLGKSSSLEGDTGTRETLNQNNKDAVHSQLTRDKSAEGTANLLNGKLAPSSQHQERLNVDASSEHTVNEHKHVHAGFEERQQDDIVVASTFPEQNQASSLGSADGGLQRNGAESVSDVNAAGAIPPVSELKDGAGNVCSKPVDVEVAKHTTGRFVQRQHDDTVVSSTLPGQSQASSLDSADGGIQRNGAGSVSDVNGAGAIPHVSGLKDGDVCSKPLDQEAAKHAPAGFAEIQQDDTVVSSTLPGQNQESSLDSAAEQLQRNRTGSVSDVNGAGAIPLVSELKDIDVCSKPLDQEAAKYAPAGFAERQQDGTLISSSLPGQNQASSLDSADEGLQGNGAGSVSVVSATGIILYVSELGDGNAYFKPVDQEAGTTTTPLDPTKDDRPVTRSNASATHETVKQDNSDVNETESAEHSSAKITQHGNFISSGDPELETTRHDFELYAHNNESSAKNKPPSSPSHSSGHDNKDNDYCPLVGRNTDLTQDEIGEMKTEARPSYQATEATSITSRPTLASDSTDESPTLSATVKDEPAIDAASTPNGTESINDSGEHHSAQMSFEAGKQDSKTSASRDKSENLDADKRQDADNVRPIMDKPRSSERRENGEVSRSNYVSSSPDKQGNAPSGAYMANANGHSGNSSRVNNQSRTEPHVTDPSNDTSGASSTNVSCQPSSSRTVNSTKEQHIKTPQHTHGDLHKDNMGVKQVRPISRHKNAQNDQTIVTDSSTIATGQQLGARETSLQNSMLRNLDEFSGDRHRKSSHRQGTCEEIPKENATWQIKEPLWKYVISNAETPWSELLIAVYVDDRKDMVELQGNLADIEKFKKYLEVERLYRTVGKEIFRVPAGVQLKTFEQFLHQKAKNTVVVRRTNDSSYCEVIGKGSDLHELRKIVDQCPRHVTGESPLNMQPPDTSASKMISQHRFPSSGSSMPTVDSELKFITSKTNMKVTIETGDILRQRCEVLVSPCNCAIDLSQGLAKLIAAAAGKGLVRECQGYIREHGSLGVSDVMDTKAGSLPPPARRVIHAHGPHLNDYNDIDSCCSDLERTFFNCLVCASKLKAASVALPAISSNNGGVPYEIVATAACYALMHFDEVLSKRPSSQRCMKEIKFVNLNQNITISMVGRFKELLAVSTPVCQDNYSGKASGQTSTNDSSRQQTGATSPSSRPNRRKKSDSQPDNSSSTPSPNSASSSVSPDADDNSCAICMDDVNKPKQLSCGHVFCTDCIERSLKYQNKCPCCGKLFGEMKGDRLRGSKMEVNKERQNLEGYRDCGRIVITYHIPDGKQQAHHPKPGRPYKGALRTAYLPDNDEGREICSLLRRAFDAGLIFAVGRSTTSGQEDVVTWNDIHHKTKPTGPYGYPDPNYLGRVREELAAKGIT